MVRELDSQSRNLRCKTIGGPKFNAAFHPFKVDQINRSNSWELVVKGKLSPRYDSAALRWLNPIHKKGL